MEYIDRSISDLILKASATFPVIVVTGPRQSGKSTLCSHLFKDYEKYNFEDIGMRQSAERDPKGFLYNCGNHVIFDEIQHVPDLFSYIQIAVDDAPERRFILTGSSNFSLMESITQSLAGRAALFTLLPFSIEELNRCKNIETDEMLLNGFYPRVIAGKQPADIYYNSYYSTYVERDVRMIKNISNLGQFQTFISLAATRVGTEFNLSAMAAEIGISSNTVKSWMSLLQASYIAFTIQPYYANIGKRLTKTPKIYFYDTGLLCRLLEIETATQLRNHPLRGSIFENLAVVELIKERYNQGRLPKIYFYRENKGHEVDILRIEGLTMDLFEVKSNMTFNSAFYKNLDYVKSLLGEKVNRTMVVYDGENIPATAINIRDLTKQL